MDDVEKKENDWHVAFIYPIRSSFDGGRITKCTNKWC